MIIDTLANSSRYVNAHPLFAKAFEFLATQPLATLENGTYEIQGKDLYASVQTPTGKTADSAKMEFHRQYIDIQMVISGDETMGWSPVEGLGHPTEYSEAKDVAFAEDKPLAWFPVRPGCFAIFFPEDAHAPCVGSGLIKKVVVKVKVQ